MFGGLAVLAGQDGSDPSIGAGWTEPPPADLFTVAVDERSRIRNEKRASRRPASSSLRRLHKPSTMEGEETPGVTPVRCSH